MNLSAALRDWYQQSGRDLPWRKTKDPYPIWLSEVILQQTRVNQGLPYFHTFLEAFPTVQDLAKAKEDEVLKRWEGLGYYSRARNLHKGAKHIAENGFPSNYEEWINVPGVGPYTASAVSSFVHDEERAVVDGNVNRVIARLIDLDAPVNIAEGKQEIERVATELIKDNPPAQHNQAIMELGALICTPKNPKCIECPWEAACKARENNTTHIRPIKLKKTKIKEQELVYTAISSADGLFVRKRDTKSIWKGLHELAPSHPSQIGLPPDAETHTSVYKVTHLLSHRKLHIEIHHVLLKEVKALRIEDLTHRTWDEIDQLAFPRPIRQWLDDILLPLHMDSES